MMAVENLARDVGVRGACDALAVPSANFYRCRQPAVEVVAPRPRPPLALSQEQEAEVLEVLHGKRFVDVAPAQVVATLLEEDVYHCSTRTMYRILERHGEVKERRNQLKHPPAAKPELLAEAPNQVWSWDITKLKGPEKWTYFYLYVVIDLYSRYIVGWLVADRECAELAKHLIRESAEKQRVDEDQLTLHSDRGPSMTSKALGQLLADLAITRSLNRPYTSNDNPFSEAHFKTLKYRPHFPDRFGSREHALSFCRTFFPWYNDEHRHSGIAHLTPATVQYGEADQVLARRARTLEAACLAHPERFKGRMPRPRPLPEQVWINPPPLDRDGRPKDESSKNHIVVPSSADDQQDNRPVAVPNDDRVETRSMNQASTQLDHQAPAHLNDYTTHRFAVAAAQ